MDGTARTQRRQPKRRQPATTRLGTLQWHGRQKVCRRSSAVCNTYLACLSPQVVWLVLFVLTCSALDALLTLLHIQHGGSEANPIMALVLDHGVISFVGLKMGLTGFGAMVLARHQHFRLGIQGLHLLAGVYTGLLVYHMVIFFSGV